MRSLSAFNDSISAAGNTRPRYLLALTTAGASGSTYYVSDSPISFNGVYPADAGLISVSPVSARCMPPEREPEIDVCEIVVDADWLRAIVAAGKQVYGAEVYLRFGLVVNGTFGANYWDYFKGVVSAIRVDGDALTATIEASSVLDVLRSRKVTGSWINVHPIDVIRDVFETTMSTEVPSSLYSAASLDPNDYDNISHFVVSRCSNNIAFNNVSTDNRLVTPTPALEVISDLCKQVDGAFWVDETGTFRFKVLDETAASDGDWTESDIKWIRQRPGRLINRVEYGFVSAATGGVDSPRSTGGRYSRQFFDHLYIQENNDSIAKYAYPGTTARRESYRVDDSWGGANTLLMTTAGAIGISNVATSFRLATRSTYRLCGTRESHPTYASQPVEARISTDRPLYLLTNAGEIIKITAMEPYRNNVVTWNEIDPEGTSTQVTRWRTWTVTASSRAQLGTSASAAKRAVDVTMAEFVASRVNARFGDGTEVLEVATGLDKFQHEIGDLVTLTWPRYLSPNFNGLTTSQKWEIVGKETDVQNADAPIKWTLCYVTSASISSKTRRTKWGMGRLGFGHKSFLNALNDGTVYKHRVSGLGITDVGGLGIEVDVGTASNGSLFGELETYLPITLPASSDCYVFFDLNSSGIDVVDLPIGDPAPSTTESAVLIGKVVTGAATISSISSSSRPDYPFDGGRLVPATIVDSKIEANRSLVLAGVVDGSKNINFSAGTGWVNKNFDNLADGATYLKLAGVSGSNLATTSSLTDLCVTTGKINDSAVTTGKLGTRAVTAAKMGQDVFRAYRNTSVQTLGTSKGYTKVEFNAEEYDTGSDFDAATNYYYTAPADTYVRFTAGLRLGNVDASQILWLSLYSTSGPTEIARGQRYYNSEGAAANASLAADFGVIRLSSGDQIYLAIYFDVNQGSGITITNGATASWFSGAEVRIV